MVNKMVNTIRFILQELEVDFSVWTTTFTDIKKKKFWVKKSMIFFGKSKKEDICLRKKSWKFLLGGWKK